MAKATQKPKAVVTPKNEHIFMALASLVDQDNLSEAEIKTYLKVEEQYVKANRLADRRKRELGKRLARIVQVTLGIKDMKELALLTPQQVEKLFDKRYSEGAFTMETPIQFLSKSHRKKLSYKDLLLAQIGQAAMLALTEAAPTGYSYTIREVAETVQ